MARYSLAARSPLEGYVKAHDGVDLMEVTDCAFVSLAIPLGEDASFAKALKAAYGAVVPEVKACSLSKDKRVRLLRLQQDLLFALFIDEEPDAAQRLDKRVREAAYITDQSDSWVMLRLSGAKTRAALERICPLDLHPDQFGEGAVARTMMDHLGVILLREPGAHHFLLLSAASSAETFLHAVETSIEHVI